MTAAKKQSLVLRVLVYLSAAFTFGALVFLVGNILIKGLPQLNAGLFSPHYTSENGSLVPALVNTLTMTALSLLMAAPLGIGAAIYLSEYANRKSKLVALVRVTAETLSGIPSIVYGLFGYLTFLVAFGWGYSLLAGACTLAIMILPLIMRSTEEALLAVPEIFREGSFGLGAGKLRTVLRIVLPSAAPGILAGIILAIGRIASETVALIYTAGTVAGVPDSVMGSGRTLSVHMYALWNEGLESGKSYATAVVLLLLVLALNAAATFIARKVGGKGR